MSWAAYSAMSFENNHHDLVSSELANMTKSRHKSITQPVRAEDFIGQAFKRFSIDLHNT